MESKNVDIKDNNETTTNAILMAMVMPWINLSFKTRTLTLKITIIATIKSIRR